MGKKNKPKKGKFLKKRNAITTATIEAFATSTQDSEFTFKNGLFNDPNRYLLLPEQRSFIVGRRKNSLLPSKHEKAAGLLSIAHFKSLQSGTVSIDAMNYVTDFLIKAEHINLTFYAEEIFSGTVTFEFSILDKTCFLPYLILESLIIQHEEFSILIHIDHATATTTTKL